MNLYQLTSSEKEKGDKKEAGAPDTEGQDLEHALGEIHDNVGTGGEDSGLPTEHTPADEESPTVVPPQDGAQAVAPTDNIERETTQTTFEGVLAQDPQQVRDQMLGEAVEANDVRVYDETSGKKWKRWMPLAIIVLVLIVLAAVGATLGVLIPRNRNAFVGTAMPTDFPSEAPSAAPSQAPTTASFDVVAQAVEATFGTTLEDTTSPQYRAAEWMAEEDQLIASPLDDLFSFSQRYAMVVFYYATGGDVSWTRQANFLSPGLDICSWQEPAPQGAFTLFDILGVECRVQRVYAIELSK